MIDRNSAKVIERLNTKCRLLFDCAILILQDQCPPDVKEYLCMKSEDYDEGACERCWGNYLCKATRL